ncbi:hypothetical protein [Sutterella sp.]|uniref:hypothetical protein n=1 Tax=Sutterella sp. TaxID=1981025 RepID=UPI0026E050E0|nr:hypothetical protein [Sutterella sp.]MDO5532308.1 hypothetical protein [Sutterella sp.]
MGVRLTLATMALTLVGGAAAINWIVFDRVGYLADVVVTDPVEHATELYNSGKYREAEEYSSFWLSLPGADEDPQEHAAVQAVEQAAREKRSDISYQATEVTKGFLLDESVEDYGQAAGALSSLLVVGDIRDLVREGWHWTQGEEVDPFITSLSALGVALTAVSIGPQAPAGGAGKTGIAVLKAAKRANKIPPRLEKEILLAVRGGTKGMDKLAPVADLVKYGEKQGLAATMEVLAKSETLAEIPRVVRAAEKYGDSGRAMLRWGGKDVVRMTEKRGAAEVRAAARYGGDAVAKLERVPARALVRDIKHFTALTAEAAYATMKLFLQVVEILFGAVAFILSGLGMMKTAAEFLARLVLRV